LFIYPLLNPACIYFYGVPQFEPASSFLTIWGPVIGCCLIPVLFMLIKKHEDKIEAGKKKTVALNCFSLLAIIAIVCLFTNWDANLRTQLGMERAIGRCDWDRVLKIAENAKQVPTRNIVMERNMALQRKNMLCDKMFTYPNGDAPIKVATKIRATYVSAHFLYYYYGLINFSYRWCMEHTVNKGLQVDYLKYMSKIALMNGEFNLARKYLNQLSHTIFYKDWAKKYESYADMPGLMEKDKEFAEIKDLYKYNESGFESNDIVEECIEKHAANFTSGTRAMMELSMSAILTCKERNMFWQLFPIYISSHEKLPAHVSEAFMLFATIDNKTEYNSFPIDQLSQNKFRQFLKMANIYGEHPNKYQLSQYKQYFGDTYWFYYFFTNVTSN
jgi:hypothetical protein